MRKILLVLTSMMLGYATFGQAGDCPYPVIFIHGWNGNGTSWAGTYNNTSFKGIWGAKADDFHAVLNAYPSSNMFGANNIAWDLDDDVKTQFVNETNVLAPGCVYAINFDNYWNESSSNPQIIYNGSSPLLESDSNESSTRKQGYGVKKAIEKVLAANPSKSKVILVGHSMGGLAIREYLQRTVSGSHIFWQVPAQADGHKVAKVLTAGTPHRGSNSFSSLFIKKEGEVEFRNSNPDLSSEAVRDLRYSYSDCLGFCDKPGVYLFGSNETQITNTYKSYDVDCDGDETSTNVVPINQPGSGNAWDGTTDNTAMALPTNVRYTWFVSNLIVGIIGCPCYGNGGDGVVDDERQWIYSGGSGNTNDFMADASFPRPTDGVNYRLSDRITSENSTSHLGQTDDVDFILHGLDEGDFPKFNWKIDTGIVYAGVCQMRPEKLPANSNRGTNNRRIDGDWYTFTLTSSVDLATVKVWPNPNYPVRIDFYTSGSPTDYSNSDATVNISRAAGSSALLSLNSPGSLAAGTYYFRVTHDMTGGTYSAAKTAWTTPYKYQVTTQVNILAINIKKFEAQRQGATKKVNISWEIASAFVGDRFIVEHSTDGLEWNALGSNDYIESKSNYYFLHENAEEGTNYYRLALLEATGNKTYSPIRQVIINSSNTFEIRKTSPNPFGNRLKVEFSSNQMTKVEYTVVNSVGQIIAKGENLAFEGINHFYLDTELFPAGIYAIILRQGSSLSQKLIVKK
jgi:hypothetical protein